MPTASRPSSARALATLARSGAYFIALIATFGSTGCYKADFHAPPQRIVTESAHTLPRNTWNPGFALAGADSLDLGVFLGVRYGITDHTQVGLNLAHMSVGILGASVKQNFIDKERWALSAQLGVAWINLDWLWIIPEETREPISNMDLLSFPLSVATTFIATDWLDLSLSANYLHTQVFGEVSGDNGVGNGTLGARAFDFAPTVRGYIGGRVALSASFRLPVWAALPAEVTALSEIEPGILAGATSAIWHRVPFSQLWGAQLDIDTVISKGFRIGVGIRHGPLNREVLHWPVVPALKFEGRF